MEIWISGCVDNNDNDLACNALLFQKQKMAMIVYTLNVWVYQ